MRILTILALSGAAPALAKPGFPYFGLSYFQQPEVVPWGVTGVAVNGSEYLDKYSHNVTARGLVARKADVVPGLYVCTGSGFTGECVWQQTVDNVCMAFPKTDSLSAGPDVGIQCRYFEGENCDLKHTNGGQTWPGVLTFKHGFENIKQVPRSYQCKRCPDPKCGYKMADPWEPAACPGWIVC